MNKLVKKLVKWVVVSSANPEEVSATVKGILLQYVGTLVSVLAIFNLSIGSEVVVNYISEISLVLGALLSMFGLARKIYFTLRKK